MTIKVIGAGLAGCECSWNLANAGYKVKLYEMKPNKRSKAHKLDTFAELVCSNSLKAERLASAAGLLKHEMDCLGSLLMQCAMKCKVDAGGALAVDRDNFSELVTKMIIDHPNIEVVYDEVTEINKDEVTVVATGPLTEGGLAQSIQNLCGDYLSFYDAAAPIVTKESVDMESAFYASRYDKGSLDAYINCPMNKAEYEEFYNELINAQQALLHGFDKPVYEGCMPVETMAKRGENTLRFGPLKPVGLRDPKTGHRPWACVQLRRENSEGSLYNLVGFQTNLKFPEQKRVFSLIPALKNADFVRYGVMHRNSFICSPKLLNGGFQMIENKNIFFAGQITGVEGYMESASSGIMAGINVRRYLENKEPFILPNISMIGSLARYISNPTVTNFQPMGANFGILPPLENHIRDKKLRYFNLAKRGIESTMEIAEQEGYKIKDIKVEYVEEELQEK